MSELGVIGHYLLSGGICHNLALRHIQRVFAALASVQTLILSAFVSIQHALFVFFWSPSITILEVDIPRTPYRVSD